MKTTRAQVDRSAWTSSRQRLQTILVLVLSAALAMFAGACGGAADPVAIEDTPAPTLIPAATTAPEPTETPVPTPAERQEPTPLPVPTETAVDSDVPTVFTEDALDISVLDNVTLDASLNRDEVLGVIASVMGPTDDLVGSINRLVPFTVELPTLADTEVVELDIHLKADYDEGRVENSYDFTFISSATRQDAALAVQTELAAAGWEVDSGQQTRAGIAVSTIGAKHPELINGFSARVNVDFTDREEGGSIGKVRSPDIGRTDVASVLAGEGWYGTPPFPEGGTFHRAALDAQATDGGNYAVLLLSEYRYEDTTLSDVNAAAQARLDESDWSLSSEPTNLTQLNLEYLGGSGLMSITGDKDINAKLQQDVVVRAPVPVSPFTPGTGLTTTTDTAAEDTAAEDSDTTADSSGTATSASSSTFAPANGSVLDESMDHAQVTDLAISLLGPTDDLAGTVARLGPFPAEVATLPNTVVTEVFVTLGTDSLRSSAPTQFENTTRVELLTTADPADAILGLQSTLVGAGWSLDAAGNETQGDVVVHFADLIGAPDSDYTYFRVTAFTEPDGDTRMVISFAGDYPDLLEQATSANGWYGSGPWPAGGTFEESTLRVGYGPRATSARIDLSTKRNYIETSESDQRAGVIAAADGADWVFAEETTNGVFLSFQGDPDQRSQVVFTPSFSDESNVGVQLRYDHSVDLG